MQPGWLVPELALSGVGFVIREQEKFSILWVGSL